MYVVPVALLHPCSTCIWAPRKYRYWLVVKLIPSRILAVVLHLQIEKGWDSSGMQKTEGNIPIHLLFFVILKFDTCFVWFAQKCIGLLWLTKTSAYRNVHRKHLADVIVASFCNMKFKQSLIALKEIPFTLNLFPSQTVSHRSLWGTSNGPRSPGCY